jgi:monosaccharide-transporting ATPase
MGMIDWRAMQRRGRAPPQAPQHLDIDLARAARRLLNIALRQMVAIARAIGFSARRSSILDEPTSSLDRARGLHPLRRHPPAEGRGRLGGVHRTPLRRVLRRSATASPSCATATPSPRAAARDRRRLTSSLLMLGKQREESQRHAHRLYAPDTGAHRTKDATPLLRAEDLTRGAGCDDVTIDIRRGEIVGFGGLLGSGRTETARLVFGADSSRCAGASCAWKASRSTSTRRLGRDRRRARPSCTEDRKIEGIVPELFRARESDARGAAELSRIRRRLAREAGCARSSSDFIKAARHQGFERRPEDSRAFRRQPAEGAAGALALQEPALPHPRRADARHRRGREGRDSALINELAASGLGVLMISSELEELVEGCGRVVVMRDGRCVAELRGADISQENIIHAMAEGGVTSDE